MWHISGHRRDHDCRVRSPFPSQEKQEKCLASHQINKRTCKKSSLGRFPFLMCEDEARDARFFFICRDRNGHWRRSCKFLRVYLYSLFILNMLLPANSKLKSFSRKLLLETSCNVGAHCIRLLDNFSLFLKHKLTDGLILFWFDN